MQGIERQSQIPYTTLSELSGLCNRPNIGLRLEGLDHIARKMGDKIEITLE